MFLNLLLVEIYKICMKPRSYIGFIAIGAIAMLIHIAMWLDGRAYISMVTQSLEQSFNIEGNILNGNLVCFIILQMLIIHVPLLVAMVTGDLMSGEAASGSLRLLATKPITRSQIVCSKFIAGLAYTLILLLFLAIVSWGAAYFIFGSGDLVVLRSDSLVILQADDINWRFVAAFMLAYLSLMLITSLSFMLSCFSNNSIGPIITTMAIMILFTIICSLEIQLFDSIKPWLFTTHMASWRLFFDNPIEWPKILNSIYILVIHVVLFFGISLYHFNRKDILV
ncbi:MAG: ABC transporter permease subunit [Bacteroidia bacterium]|nr:ABC transporter permease subunit [Bacteroidia bacterium]